MKLLEQLKKGKFSSDSEKSEKINLSSEDFASQNPYYAAIARGYHIAQLAVFGLLSAFIILSMLIRSDDITYENFFYLFKDIHAAVDSHDIGFQTLVYNADETQDFATYRGGLAVAGESGLTVFSATGRQTLVQTLNMTSPKLLSSTDCILVYELNGTDYALYNSFARISAGQSDSPIRAATLSDSGRYAIATQNDSSAKIAVYNKHSSLIVEHFLNGYVTALSLNSNGDLLAVLTTDAVNGNYQTKLTLYRTGTEEKILEQRFDGLFPLSCEFADNKTLYLTTQNNMLVFNRNGDITVSILSASPINRAFYSEAGYALLSEDGVLTLYKKNGTIIGKRENAQDIRAVLIGQEHIYMITEYSLIEYSMKDGQGTQTDFDFPLQQLLWYSEDELLLCSRSTARFIQTAD